MKMILVMKRISCLLVFSILVSPLFHSCRKALSESQFNEFQITSPDGMERSGGIYLPSGMKPDDRLPVIYMADGLVFKDCGFSKMIDSLIENRCISPIVVACSFENKKQVPGFNVSYRNAEYIESLDRKNQQFVTLFDNHYTFFTTQFIPYIEKVAHVSDSREDRLFFGTSNSADFGITLSFRAPELISEYWCYSPVFSDIKDYGLLSSPTSYRICWGAKEEAGMFDYFPNLIKDIRKRGGNVHSWVFNGGHDREWWKYWFSEELKRRFPYKD